MLKIIKLHSIFIILILGIASLVNVKCVKSSKEDLSKLENDTSLVGNLPNQRLDKAITHLILATPSPLLMANILKSSGANYEGTLLNPISNLKKYQQLEEKALNLGAYSADLSYASVFNKKKEALDYFNGVSRLAEDIGVGNIFNKQLKTRVDENQNNQDSLEKIFADTFTQLRTELKKKNQEQILSLMFTGGWIEGLYLATEIWRLNPNRQLATRIAEQKELLENILEILEETHPQPRFLIQELKQLQHHFNKIKVHHQTGKNQLNPHSQIIKVGGNANYIFDNSTIDSIRTKAGDIRKKIVLCQIPSA